MATVDELLAAETTESDDELSFLIDEHLRIITVPERGVVLGVEGDKDVNRVRFRMNRYYHGSDLSSFQIRINYQNADGEVNYFTVSEKTVDTDTFSFVWVVAADAVMTKGTVLFVVNCFTTDSSDVVQKAYHTTLGAASVLEGLEVDVEGNQPQIVDFLSKLKNELTVHAGTVLQQMDDYAKSAENSKTAASNYADDAGNSASAAKASEGNAKTSETEAAAHLQATKEYFEQVRTITIGAQGWYATPEALKAAVPVGENGWWAVVGTTDTIWTWDSDTGAWVNTQTKVDLSDYLTQTQIKALLAGYMPLRAATTTVLGGIKVGDNLSIDADGTLNGVEGGYSKDEIDSKLKRLESMIDSDGQLVYSTMVTVKAKTDNPFITETVTTNTSIPDDVSYISIFMVSTSTEGSLERCRLARGGSASFSFKDIGNADTVYNANANFVGSTLTVTTYKVAGKANAKFNVFGYKYL